jgi:lipopolysaccharide/colanic/teichoic acid biosynthesis glycosyltransferase
MRRLFDIGAGIVGLIAASPLMAIIAAAVLVDSGRPVFFRQTRVGRRGVPFTLVKFRSMAVNHTGGPLTPAGDGNVTRTGRLLRAWKLDELPQLWNVLRGHMAMVGPRPELRQFVEQFPAEFRFLLTVRPGLTDPASLAFRNEADILARHADPRAAYVDQILPQKLRLSADYLRRRTWATDVRLIWHTITRGERKLAS